MSTPTALLSASDPAKLGLTPAFTLHLHRAWGVCDHLRKHLEECSNEMTPEVEDVMERLTTARNAISWLVRGQTGACITHRYPDAKNWPRLEYTGNDGLKLLQVIQIDERFWLELVGDPDNASYEWGVRFNGHVGAHSDMGYGESSVALMDGLMHIHGLPARKGAEHS